jgi:hypothetical protein
MFNKIFATILVLCILIALNLGLSVLNEYLIDIESTISIIGRFLIMTLGSLFVLYISYMIIMKIGNEPIKSEQGNKGVAVAFAGSDLSAFTKGSEEEANAIFSNCSIKVALKETDSVAKK